MARTLLVLVLVLSVMVATTTSKPFSELVANNMWGFHSVNENGDQVNEVSDSTGASISEQGLSDNGLAK